MNEITDIDKNMLELYCCESFLPFYTKPKKGKEKKTISISIIDS